MTKVAGDFTFRLIPLCSEYLEKIQELAQRLSNPEPQEAGEIWDGAKDSPPAAPFMLSEQETQETYEASIAESTPSVDRSFSNSHQPSNASLPLSILNNHSTMSSPAVTIPRDTSSPKAPDIPSSILQTTYMELHLKLIAMMNSEAGKELSSKESLLSTTTTVGSEGNESTKANLASMPRSNPVNVEIALRGKITKILQQIQLASDVATISSFRPIAVAFQLCLIEQSLLRKIHQNDLLNHKPPHSPAPSLQASAEFFNYFTRIVECTVLEPLQPVDRAKTIIKWIKVATKLRRFNNFQSLKAVVCALYTPPISRLKRTWAIVRRKPEYTELLEFRSLLSEESNYSAYRQWLRTSLTRPLIPFIGVLIHDATYILTVAKREGTDPLQDRRIQDIQRHLRYCTSGPRYSYEVLSAVDLSIQAAKKGIQFRRKISGGLSEQGQEELHAIRDFEPEEMGDFINHWILSRTWISEKEVDELSLAREPRMQPLQPVSVSAPTSRIASPVDVLPPKEEKDERRGPNETWSTANTSFSDIIATTDNADFEAYLHDINEKQGGAELIMSPNDSFSNDIQNISEKTPVHDYGAVGKAPLKTNGPMSLMKQATSQNAVAASVSSPAHTRRKPVAANTLIDAIKGTAFSIVQSGRTKPGHPALTRKISGKSLSAADMKDAIPVEPIALGASTEFTALNGLLKKDDKVSQSDDWSLNSLKSLSIEPTGSEFTTAEVSLRVEVDGSEQNQDATSPGCTYADKVKQNSTNDGSKTPTPTSLAPGVSTASNRRPSFFGFSSVFSSSSTSSSPGENRVVRRGGHKKSVSCDVPDLELGDGEPRGKGHRLGTESPVSSPLGGKPLTAENQNAGMLTPTLVFNNADGTVKSAWGAYPAFRKQLSDGSSARGSTETTSGGFGSGSGRMVDKQQAVVEGISTENEGVRHDMDVALSPRKFGRHAKANSEELNGSDLEKLGSSPPPLPPKPRLK
ncbi:hypothetical protein HDU97_007474 [Phlyctochytrium planicorne]|nr:hypothetical protein HDU97_007474 [Phlyctochytrium planicorne]